MRKLFILLSLLFSITLTSANAVEVTKEEKITGLYVAYFNRAADQEGLKYWTDKSAEVAEAGGDVSSVFKKLSGGFATHPTFKSTYDHLDNEEFVSLIYRNALGRAGDFEGIDYWTKKLDNEGMIRSDMVSDFVELSLVTDLTPENYPNLSNSELAAGQLRQDLISNKVTASLAFTHQLGILSNVVDSQDPEQDPAYLASIKIISEVTEDPETVFAALISLDGIKGELGGVEEGVTYSYPDLSEISAENKALAQSLKETQAALLQATLLINSYIYTDSSITDFSTYEKRRLRALDAFKILDEKISISLIKEESENTILFNRKLQSLKTVEDKLFATDPQNGNRPIKDLLEGYKSSTKVAMDTLALPGDLSVYQDYSKYNLEQKRLAVMIETGRCGLVYIGGIVGIAVVGGTVTGAAAVPAIATVLATTAIVGVSQFTKVVMATLNWRNAESGFKQEPVPQVFTVVQDVAEFATLVTMNGTAVIFYGTDKMLDLIKSGRKTISFGGHDINVFKLTQEMIDVITAVDPSKWPAVERGEYISTDGKHIIVEGLPKEYYDSLSDLNPEDRLIMMPTVATPIDREFIGSVDVTLISPDKANVVYRVNGGDLLLYTEPITLTETSTIVAYAAKDPYDENAAFSEVSTFQYTKVEASPDSGQWVLSETIVYTSPGINDNDCYESSLNISSGSFTYSDAVSESVCNWDYSESVTFTGSWSPPPSILVPGTSYPMNASVSRSNPVEQWGTQAHLDLNIEKYDVECGFGTAGRIHITDGWLKVIWRASDPSTDSWSGSFTAPAYGFGSSTETAKIQIKAETSGGCVRYIYKWSN